ncbi:GNAT family N-acetyltransferase [Massilia sp. BJB1822]|uniref:GNAT family N-acetyltransferase n=1 Tax=Massilia sp. BJB1822 TaxID=2744470 RepID=UPI001593BEC1|nr:GNAT family N-acetyltransferase [Massilia sp. BJB1822]NVE00672.1 GNAT family N-acetyltransferase [Massilia sp. BJB1822]
MPEHCPPALFGKRIKLRCLEERDAPALLELYGDPEVMRYWCHGPWRTLNEAKAAIAEAHKEYAEGSSLHLVIEHLEQATLIGSCALYGMVAQERRATVGYLLSRSYWGQGYLKEALCVLLDYAMAELKINRIEAEVRPGNMASCKALKAVGFKAEGYLRERWLVGGAPCDVVLYALLHRDWRARGEYSSGAAFTRF